MNKFSILVENVESQQYFKIKSEIDLIVEASSEGEASYIADSTLASVKGQSGYNISSVEQTNKEEFFELMENNVLRDPFGRPVFVSQDSQEETFLDTGYFSSITITSGSYGEPIENSVSVSPISCSFHWTGGKESWKEPINYLKIDGLLKIPYETIVDQTYQFILTKQKTETLSTPITFQVVSNPRKSISGIIIDLKKVET